MFKGNIYFALPIAKAADLFTAFEQSVEQGLFSNPVEPGNRLFYFDDEKSAVEFGRKAFADGGVAPVPGALNQTPVFAVVHIGPIAPMGLPGHAQSTAELLGVPCNVLEAAALARVAQIVRTGSFAWNAVDMSLKLFTL